MKKKAGTETKIKALDERDSASAKQSKVLILVQRKVKSTHARYAKWNASGSQH